MRKIMIGLIISILIFLIAIYGVWSSDYNEKGLVNTLTIKPEDITHISISNMKGDYKTTYDQEKINTFIYYLERLHYKRLRGDQSAYMPMKARMIYLYAGDTVDFIVPYKTEAMISYKVYQIHGGQIENAFLLDFYNSL